MLAIDIDLTKAFEKRISSTIYLMIIHCNVVEQRKSMRWNGLKKNWVTFCNNRLKWHYDFKYNSVGPKIFSQLMVVRIPLHSTKLQFQNLTIDPKFRNGGATIKFVIARMLHCIWLLPCGISCVGRPRFFGFTTEIPTERVRALPGTRFFLRNSGCDMWTVIVGVESSSALWLNNVIIKVFRNEILFAC